ncbi:DUF4347 domain-containing protein [Planktothrix agardhii]|uniref:DUF4347 domain-containing protein n=1 Tax=Planktothrix agardhii TaxID=1160 RepID=UPI000416138B|nr:DUF4347 domain-containing protein [Planktothrix agardhii]CAD0227786.1 hypothetical protein PL10110_350018 [Planktothrix agardhii]CAD5980927.1 Leukotoxin [Planktothrix agardhii]
MSSNHNYIQDQVKTVVVIDSSVDNYETLLQGVDPNAEVIILDPNQDGIAQISSILSTQKDIDALHIISHGESGSLQLGTTVINANNLDQYSTQLSQWQASLTENADILLYGCNVASGSLGQSFVTNLSQLTGADIAASNDLTGNAALGGNWALEVQTGNIETALAFSQNAIRNYQGILLPLAATNFGVTIPTIPPTNGTIKNYDALGAPIDAIPANATTTYTMDYYGNRNNDTLMGGEGNDNVYGGEQDDVLYGDAGNDLLFGDQGTDILCGGNGDDTIYGGVGSHNVVGNSSDLDQLSGGAGNDLLLANEGENLLCGGDDNDTLYSGQQNDTLNGGAGDDWLFGDLGDDLITGGTGKDYFVIGAGTGFDQITDFRVGEDFLVLANGLTLNQLTIIQEGTSTLINLGDQPLVRLAGVQANLIISNSFQVLG